MKDKIDIIIEGKMHTGTYAYDHGRHIICYDATVDEEGTLVSYEMTIDEDTLIVSQSGAIDAVMIYSQDGSPHECIYKTAYGDIPMLIHTYYLAVENMDDSMTIDIRYQILQDGSDDSKATDNILHIDIRSATT